MEQPPDPLPVTNSKLAFVLANTLFIALLVLVGHVGLVSVYGFGEKMTLITGAILTAVIILMLIWQNEQRFSPLVVGVLLWAVVGEIAGQLGYVDIVSIRNVFVLSPAIVLVGYLARKDRLSDFLIIASVFFLTIWTCHFILVNLFEQLGAVHPLTFVSSSLFLAMLILAILGIRRSDSRRALTVHSILVLCSFWSMLEYLWAWRVVPKPWGE